MRSVEFHPETEAELVSAAQYFESHIKHLGLVEGALGCLRSLAQLDHPLPLLAHYANTPVKRR